MEITLLVYFLLDLNNVLCPQLTMIILKLLFKTKGWMEVEMAHWFKTPTVLLEDLGTIPSIHTVDHNHL